MFYLSLFQIIVAPFFATCLMLQSFCRNQVVIAQWLARGGRNKKQALTKRYDYTLPNIFQFKFND